MVVEDIVNCVDGLLRVIFGCLLRRKCVVDELRLDNCLMM